MTEETKSTKRSPGPHGYGNPDDISLRKVETEVLIPKKMREITHASHCKDVVADFNKCGKEAGLGVIVKCRAENTALWNCLEKWYKDEDFKSRCTQEYLKERSEYRRTGIKRKVKDFRKEREEEKIKKESVSAS